MEVTLVVEMQECVAQQPVVEIQVCAEQKPVVQILVDVSN